MKVLMLLRDPMPTARADVAVLFDRCLREDGIASDFAGHPHTSGAQPPVPMTGRFFDIGHRESLRSVWAQLSLVWRQAGRYDLLVVRDKPIVAALARWLAARRGTPCAYWMSFPIPAGDRVGAGEHRRNGLWLRAAFVWTRAVIGQQVLDRIVLPHCDHLFVQSDAMRRAILDSVRIEPARVTAVPMGVDPRLLGAIGAEPLAPADAGRGPVLAYLGAMDRWRRLDVMIDAFARVRQRVPGARLWMIGSALHPGDLAWLESHARLAGVADAVEFRGAMPMADAWRLIRGASVCLSPIAPGPLYDVSSPTKVVEYLALGLPVVASDIPDQKHLLARCGGGRCVPFDAQAFAAAVLELLDDGAASREAAVQAGPRLLALRSYDVLAAQVASCLRRLQRAAA